VTVGVKITLALKQKIGGAGGIVLEKGVSIHRAAADGIYTEVYTSGRVDLLLKAPTERHGTVLTNEYYHCEPY
jgi:hypothetical protein